MPPAGAAGPDVIKRGSLFDRSVAIDAIQFDGRARLAVELSIAVIVLLEMAIDALHSFFEMDVLQVNGFVEFLWIVGSDDLIVCVEQIALAVPLEHGAEHPAVAVKIGELRFVQLRVEFRTARLCQKFRIGPQAARCGTFRIALRDLILFFFGRIALLAPDTSPRRRLRCPTRCSRNKWSPCSCPDGHGRPCTGWRELNA